MPDRTCKECGQPPRPKKHLRFELCDNCYNKARRRGLLPSGTAGTCTADEPCDKPVHAHGLCHGHYLMKRRHGRTTKLELPTRDGCDVPGCDREHFALGYCQGHYGRLQKHGDVLADKPLRPRRYQEPYIIPQGYRVLPGGHREHRVVMERMLDRPLLPGENVHHRNGVKHDNRPENLELWVTTQPAGQRVEDVVAHALAMLQRYAPDLLAEEAATVAA